MRHISAGGVVFTLTPEADENDPELMQDLTVLGEWIRQNVPEPTEEQIERQKLAAARNRERVKRIMGR